MNVEDRLLIKNLAKTAELINTINGGMAQAKLKVSKYDDEWTVHMQVPGVSPENLKIEVRENQLFIFQLLSAENSSKIQLPFLLSSFVLSPKVDAQAISAEYEDGEVFIWLPFDELSDGFEREINIIKR